MTFAGNIKGVTRTIPLSVYSMLQIPGREKDAGLLVLISIGISFAALFLSSCLDGRLPGRRRSAGGRKAGTKTGGALGRMMSTAITTLVGRYTKGES